MNDDSIFELCDEIRQTAYDLFQYLKCGHLEKVYENGLAHRLRTKQIKVDQQVKLQVQDQDGTVLGDFVADLLVEEKLIVELKSCKALDSSHTAQLIGYLRCTGIEHGLLINFGTKKFEARKLIFSQPE